MKFEELRAEVALALLETEEFSAMTNQVELFGSNVVDLGLMIVNAVSVQIQGNAPRGLDNLARDTVYAMLRDVSPEGAGSFMSGVATLVIQGSVAQLSPGDLLDKLAEYCERFPCSF